MLILVLYLSRRGDLLAIVQEIITRGYFTLNKPVHSEQIKNN